MQLNWDLLLPPVLSAVRGPDGVTAVRVAGQASRSYEVEASVDLRKWLLMGSANTEAASIEMPDPASKNPPFRYYRAVARSRRR